MQLGMLFLILLLRYPRFEMGATYIFHPLSLIHMYQNIFSVCFSHGIAYLQPESLTGRNWKTLP